jgi:hypothetical protein
MKEYFICTAKHLVLDIKYPYQEMLEEAKRLSHRFVPHRSGLSEGWESLTLHGLGEDKTGSWEDYGYATGGDAAKDMFWTDAAKESPITYKFLTENFPSNKFGRIRFMKLKAGGYIGPHSDSSKPIIENINLVLNNPKECTWVWNDTKEEVFMEPGLAYGMNVHYTHSIYNNSNEDRYHMIVVRHDSTDEWKSLITTAANTQDTPGDFVTIDFLP